MNTFLKLKTTIRNFFKISFFFIIIASLTTCAEGEQINLFTIQDDINLGKRVRDEILSNPQEYPILTRSQYPEAYSFLQQMRDTILTKSNLNYADRFEWEVYIIQNDEVLNAFVAPGGYIFFYTGLLKYLDSADELAGVMAHEIAHADQRHTTENLTKIYGVTLLLQIVLGDGNDILTDITRDLATNISALGFSRAVETEADALSVDYLSKTEYACNGAAGFFEKLLSEGQTARMPVWLSSHPEPQERVMDINDKAQTISCSINPINRNYQDFVNTLP